MVIELSERTYDWERLHERGKVLTDTLDAVMERVVELEDETKVEAIENAIINSWGDNYRRYEHEDGGVHIDVPSGDTPGQTYDLSFTVVGGEIRAKFIVYPEFTETGRVLLDASFWEADPDTDEIRELLSYIFETVRKAISLESKTMLSQREAEVVLLRREGYDDEWIATLMGVESSNVTQYASRIEEKQENAEEQQRRAQATLDLLSEDAK